MGQHRYFAALAIHMQRNQLAHVDLLSHTKLTVFPIRFVAGLTPWPPLHQRWRGGRGAGAWLLGLLAARYGATVVHLRRIFWVFPFPSPVEARCRASLEDVQRCAICANYVHFSGLLALPVDGYVSIVVDHMIWHLCYPNMRFPCNM